MRAAYNHGTEAIETVYTYLEWEREYKNRRAEKQAKTMQKVLQKLVGIICLLCAVACCAVFPEDATGALLFIPLGLFLLLTKHRVTF